MTARQLKTGYFILEGVNSFATVYYSYYLYFYMQREFGFGNRANLALAALNGGVYMMGAWWGGRFGQRFGYFSALKLGYVLMALALSLGPQAHSATGQVLIMCAIVIGMCFTWPNLEALSSEGETRAGLHRMMGIYNVVWAATGAVAYFTGGALLDQLGLHTLFYLPAVLVAGQLALTVWLERQARKAAAGPTADPRPQEAIGGEAAETHPALAKPFLRLAWVANPLAYIGISTLIAVIPGLAHRLGLSTMAAGFCCSVWCFARLGAFLALWFWDGWHYRFRWLLTAYLTMIAAFATILLESNLVALVLAQIVFGLAVGLIYSSSLFYSMDVGETKGEHGGIHEAAIGLGNCAGPAVGAASLYFLPGHPESGTLGVTALLLLGAGGLLAMRPAPRASHVHSEQTER